MKKVLVKIIRLFIIQMMILSSTDFGAVYADSVYNDDVIITTGEYKYNTKVDENFFGLNDENLQVTYCKVDIGGLDKTENAFLAGGLYNITIGLTLKDENKFSNTDGVYDGDILVNGEAPSTKMVYTSSDNLTIGGDSKYLVIEYSKQINEHTVTFHENAGGDTVTNMPSDPTNYVYGRKLLESVIRNAVPLRDGYGFLGWSMTVGGNTIPNPVMTDGNLDLYAVWGQKASHDGGMKITIDNRYKGGILPTGDYYLNDNVFLNDEVIITNESSVSLCLNGHILDLGGSNTIRNGTFDICRRIYCDGYLSLDDCQHENNYYKYYFSKDSLTGLYKLSDSDTNRYVIGGVITGGYAYDSDVYNEGGGAIITSKGLAVNNVNFVGNESEGYGGAIYSNNEKIIDINNCNFVGNISGSKGGAIYNDGCSNIVNSDFMNNIADSYGGAICCYDAIALLNCNIINNSAEEGGGIYAEKHLSIVNTKITNNTASSLGGGVSFYTYSCFAEGTKITMPDGSLVNIEDIKYGDEVRTFNHETGTYSNEEVYYVYKSSSKENGFTLNFTNDISLTIMDKHDLFEKSSLSYVTVNSDNVGQYIGKYFYNATSNSWEQLLTVANNGNPNYCYSIYTYKNFNCIANNMLSVPDDADYRTKAFTYNDDLTINQTILNQDIEKYGLLDFDDCIIIKDREVYDDYNLKYFNILIGKGVCSLSQLLGDYADIIDNVPASQILTGSFLGASLELYEQYYDDYDNQEDVLLVGDNTQIKNNKVGENINNVYLGDNKIITIIKDSSGVKAGVNIKGKIGIFSNGNYDISYKNFFTSDEGLIVNSSGTDGNYAFSFVPVISEINNKAVSGQANKSYIIGKTSDLVAHIVGLDLSDCSVIDVYYDKNNNNFIDANEPLTLDDEYVLEDGSILLTINKTFLDTLGYGKHYIKAKVTTNSSDTYSFNIEINIVANNVNDGYRVVKTGIS